MSYRLSPRAEADLTDIGDFIARENPAAAIRLLGRIEKACAMLGDNPLIGRARPEIAPAARSWAIGRYLILYRPTEMGAEIIRVIHGARDLNALDI